MLRRNGDYNQVTGRMAQPGRRCASTMHGRSSCEGRVVGVLLLSRRAARAVHAGCIEDRGKIAFGIG
jgi:hypothetical protein